MKAIETTGRISKKRLLTLDTSIEYNNNKKVKVILMFPDEEEEDDTLWLKAAANNPAFAFLKEPEEDIYSNKDGKPVKK